MRASLRDIQLTEAYLKDQLSPSEKQSFEQRLLLEPLLYEQVYQQKRIYQLLRRRGRRQLRRELNQLHADLFSTKGNRSWQNRILAFFVAGR